jgi:cobalt-zinc-cadmium efflux system outer membrane protein
VESPVAAVAAARTAPDVLPCAATVEVPAGPLDLAAVWGLALANNPTLREAAADVEAARGRQIQAGKYPNPHLAYRQEELGTQQAPAGTISVEVSQEIVTGGKRGLDVAIAGRGTDVASLALLGRKFEVLTRVRRLYYDYRGWRHTARVNAEVLAALRQGLEVTRRLVEEAKTRPRTDLIRLEALVEEARVSQERTAVNVQAAWRQLAAEVGLPHLPMPEAGAEPLPGIPLWDADAVLRRVLAANTDLKQAAVETERARLEVERAQAEAVPNVTVGSGYSRNFPEHEMGAVVSVELPLPLWDRKQGRIYEAQARLTHALAARRSTATRLSQATAEAQGRYEAALRQLDRVNREVLPRLRENLALLRRGYQAGSTQVTFADVLLAEQTWNDTRLRLAAVRQELWRAVADLEGLMQLDLGEEGCVYPPLPSEARGANSDSLKRSPAQTPKAP